MVPEVNFPLLKYRQKPSISQIPPMPTTKSKKRSGATCSGMPRCRTNYSCPVDSIRSRNKRGATYTAGIIRYFGGTIVSPLRYILELKLYCEE